MLAILKNFKKSLVHKKQKNMMIKIFKNSHFFLFRFKIKQTNLFINY